MAVNTLTKQTGDIEHRPQTDHVSNLPSLETSGLVDSLEKYEQVHEYLMRLQNASARRALNALDLNINAGPKRDVVRQEILDALGYFRREIEKWLKSELPSGTEAPQT